MGQERTSEPVHHVFQGASGAWIRAAADGRNTAAGRASCLWAVFKIAPYGSMCKHAPALGQAKTPLMDMCRSSLHVYSGLSELAQYSISLAWIYTRSRQSIAVLA